MFGFLARLSRAGRALRPVDEAARFRRFLGALGVSLREFQEMDPPLKADILDRYTYVFCRSPLDGRIAAFRLYPDTALWCARESCEWQETHLPTFGTTLRICVRCRRTQMRHHENTLWSEIGVDQFSFFRDQDESFRAKWGTPRPAAAPTELSTRAPTSRATYATASTSAGIPANAEASGAPAGGASAAPSVIRPLPEVHNQEQAA